MPRLRFLPLVGLTSVLAWAALSRVIAARSSQRIRDFGHDKLRVYGVGREKSHEHWVSVIRQLIWGW